jgi:DNA-binding transcriptional LysR family regulator
VRLTDAGRLLLPFAERTLRDFADVAEQVNKLSAYAARTISVAATPLVAADLLPGVCRDLHASRPDIRVVVRDVDRRQIQSMVESGEVDVGLGILFKPGSTISRDLLMRLPLVCVSAPGTIEKKKARENFVTWSELRKLPMIGLPPDNAIQQLVDKALNSSAPTADRPTFGNLRTLIAMAETGRGVAVLPAFVTHACARYQVEVRRVRRPDVLMEFFAITKKGADPSPALAPLLEHLKARMAPLLRLRDDAEA